MAYRVRPTPKRMPLHAERCRRPWSSSSRPRPRRPARLRSRAHRPVEAFVGRAQIGREPGWRFYNLRGPSRWEAARFAGERLVLVLPKPGERGVASVMRLDTVEDRVARIRVYAFCPDAVREIAAALDRPAATLGLCRFHPARLQLPQPPP
jgi:hypothetical protein